MKSFPGYIWWAVVLSAALPVARGLWFDLRGRGTKCVSEELHRNVVVVGDYYAFIGEQEDEDSLVPTISVSVTSPDRINLHRQENVTYGQFAFTTSETGIYLACFWEHGDHHGGKTVTVGIDWKTGIATKDWDAVAKKENIQGLELELVKIEASVKLVRGNLIYLKNRQAALREASEATNARVAWYGIASLGVCIGVSVLQVWYLRRFFRKNRLI